MNHVDTPLLNLLSLCSGAGQLDIGASAAFAGHGIRTRHVGYCERESASCAALRSRMEEEALEPAPIWGGNLEDFPCGPFRGMVDGIVAGFPCQPHSVAGKREGRDDERNLLPAILGIADDVGAHFLLLENVAGLKKEFGYITGILLQRGWAAEWGTLRACDVGASHRRDRWFGVAYRQCEPGRAQQLDKPGDGLWWLPAARDGSMPDDAGTGLPAIGKSNRRGSSRPDDIKRSGGPTDSGSEQLLADGPCPRREPKGGVAGAIVQGGECLPGNGCGEILADGIGEGLQGQRRDGDGSDQCGRVAPEPAGSTPAGGDALELELGHAAGDDQRRMPDGEHREGQPCGGPSGAMVNGASECRRDGHRCERPDARREYPDASREMGDPGGIYEQEGRQDGLLPEESEGGGRHELSSLPVFAPGPSDSRWGGILAAFPFLAPALPDLALRTVGHRMDGGDEMEIESPLRILADGMESLLGGARADMLRIIGNGVVPQQAARAFYQLLGRITV